MVLEEYRVENLSCATCSAMIESEIASLSTVQSVNLDYIAQKLTIHYYTKPPKALERLNKIANAIEPGTKIHQSSEALASQNQYKKWIPIALGVLLYIFASLFISTNQVYFFLLAYLLVGLRVGHSAIRKLFTLRVFDEHFLMTIATVGAVYLGQYSEAIAVMLLYEIGQYFEGLSVNKSRSSLKKMLALKPEKAHVMVLGQILDKRLAEVKVNDTILVQPGERIPLDGVVQKGESSVDTSSLTGESEPLFVKDKSMVFGGFLNGDGLLEILVSKIEAESTVSRILKLIEDAAKRKSRTEQFITRFAKVYTPLVVTLALLLFLIPVVSGASIRIWLPRALIFLIISCPCALVISIPLTYYIGIGIAAKRGIIFKGSVFLDNLRRVKTLVFDKTGTLTTGNMQVEEIVATTDAEELMRAACICELRSNHPLARALRDSVQIPVVNSDYSSYKETPGKGISAVYSGISYHTGSIEYLRDQGYSVMEPNTENTLIHVGKAGVYLGFISFSDEIKVGMITAIKQLRTNGISHFSVLSGDRIAKVKSVAAELDLDSFQAKLAPGLKVQGLEKLMQSSKGLTAFVGDGLNDAPVLARADIGIAMGEIGNQASIEIADVVLLNDRPEQLTAAFRLSKATYRIAVQNISLALGVKVAVMILGAFGLSNLWEAVIADVGVTLAAIFNAMRLYRIRI